MSLDMVFVLLGKFHKDLTSGTMSILHLSSDWKEPPSEASVKVSSRSDIRNHVKTYLSSKSRRTWTFLTNLEMVSDGS